MKTHRAPWPALGPVFLILTLSGCFSISSTLELTPGGSGTLELEYRISHLAASFSGQGGASLPLPVNEADFRSAVAAAPGLSLQAYSRSEDREDVIVRARIAFNDIAALNRILERHGGAYVLRNEGALTVLEQLVSPGFEELDETSEALFRDFFSTYEMRFTLRAPRPIQSANNPQTEIRDREAVVRYGFMDLLTSRERVVWAVSW